MIEPAHILIIDDDSYASQSLSLRLGEAGYSTTTLSSGREALAFLQTINPDLLVIEHFLPDIDGQELITQLKANESRPFTPAILITASEDLQSRVTALDAGADDVLVKPIEIDEFLARVRSLLRLQRSQRSLQAEQRKTQLLLHLTRELGGTSDLEALLTRFLDHLADAVGAVRASIILTDPNDGSISCYSNSRNPASPLLGEVLKDGVAGWALREKQPIIINDTRTDKRWIGDASYHRTVRSVASMPVMREGRALGVITLVHHLPNYFTDEHIDLLHSVAAQSAVALESAQLYSLTHHQKELIERRAEDLQRVNEMSQHLTELMRPEQLMRLVVHMLQHVFGYPQVTIMLQEGDHLVVQSRAGQLGGPAPQSDREALNSGVNGWVLFTKRLYRIDDFRFEQRFLPTPTDPPWVCSKLVVPLVQRHEVYGTLDIQSADPYAFGPNDEAILSTIVNQFGVALGNARLYRTIEDERSRLDAVLRSAVDPILMIGPQNELLLANPAAEERLGINLKQGYGKPIESQIAHPSLVELLTRLGRDADGRARESVELELTPNCIYSVSVSPVAGTDDKQLGSVAVLQDITALRLLERREQERLRSVFRRYVSPVVAEQLMEAGTEFGVATERWVVVVCIDMRDFTALTERVSPLILVNQILNPYFSLMTQVVHQYDGTIDKFLGDGMLAVFGSPISHSDDPQRALQASIELQRAFQRLHDTWKLELGVDITIGIGLSYGPAVVGNIGSEERLDYTLIGDVVNTASRLCGMAKAGQVIVSHLLVEMLPPDDDFRAYLSPLGKVMLKGKQDPHLIYEVNYDVELPLQLLQRGQAYLSDLK